jgi:serine/tyrosine/threonine adenylyltransferase
MNVSVTASSPLSDAAATNGWRLEHTYATLPARLHQPWPLAPASHPRLVILNRALAHELGLDPARLESDAGAAIFAGNQLPPGSQPLAQAYAGHQFGHFTGLGDGRALLLGEQITPDGRRFDIQLKGSGRTPFSRGGDGRAALGPMLREYLISEAMQALGIPTTRSLAVAATGEPVFRQEGPLPGAVLTRVAASHIRVGTFSWLAAHQDTAALQALTAYTLRRHAPEHAEAANPALALFQEVLERQASLVARWINVGFVHGVMNTDNMALSGETIDYGPCAFLDAYDPAAVFSSIDHHGRYAFGQQPAIAQWNLARLAEALLPILHPEPAAAMDLAQGVLDTFAGRYTEHEADDALLGQALLDWMREQRADFTNTFVALSFDEAGRTPPFADAAFQSWHQRWLARLQRQPQAWPDVQRRMRAHNPFIIPRNHRVEEALTAAVEQNDLDPFQRLLAVLTAPYAYPSTVTLDHPETQPAPAGSPPYQTFCGT